MSQPQPLDSHAGVSVLLLRPVFRFAAVVAPQALPELHEKTGVTDSTLADQDARVDDHQLASAWRTLQRLIPDSNPALAIASAASAGAFGLVEYVCRSSSTVGEAMLQWTRYLRLLNDTNQVALVLDQAVAYIRVVAESPHPAPLAHELCFALLISEARNLSAATWQPLSVAFRHRRQATTGTTRAHMDWFGCPVTFDADYDQITLPRSVLDLPLSSADRNLLAILQVHADACLSTLVKAPPLVEQVRRALTDILRTDENNHLVAVAKKLGLSERVLQRRLKEQGQRFVDIRDAVRVELSNRYLDDHQLSIAEISFLLGFSEPSAFFRAFKRWRGATPMEIRQGRRAQSVM
jgi:AraC-like DNA-binding protein